jgi:hypothetical protein
MRAKIGLFVAAIFVRAACASCAARQQPGRADNDAFREMFAIVGEDLNVAFQVPTGWDVDLGEAARGEIRMSSPNTEAVFGLVFVETDRGTPETVAAALGQRWQEEAEANPQLAINGPQMVQTDGQELWVLVIDMVTNGMPMRTMHLIYTANDRNYVVAAIGAWPSSTGDLYSGMLGTVAGSVLIVPDEVTASEEQNNE